MTGSKKQDTITLAQLEAHSVEQDLWIAVHGRVYNLTSFAKDHPGGIEVLKTCAGTDGSETYDYAGHSSDAINTMQQFLVGSLENHISNSEQRGGDLNNRAETMTTESTIVPKSAILINPDIAARISLLMAGLGVVAGLYWYLNGSVIAWKPYIGLNHGGTANVVYVFLSGLVVASLLSSAGFAFLYTQFSKTLKHEEDVFSYPPVIPRRVGR
ncbi:hypothetical protein AJ79_01017 [Helicocarpus griseus UAMH5409]|uniref:Cytochrome b5 heme-binding domain-containing protein n=1 Tax=Helicocarpus griseus UAMH5409 TaxID=1447875 RepID=A0A2B7Y8T4_9EURO|nr:hypothetical protein AJ79_01017 [Helicocarpus griseus UAMH5409]